MSCLFCKDEASQPVLMVDGIPICVSCATTLVAYFEKAVEANDHKEEDESTTPKILDPPKEDGG